MAIALMNQKSCDHFLMNKRANGFFIRELTSAEHTLKERTKNRRLACTVGLYIQTSKN